MEDGVFTRAWDVLQKNPVIVVPSLIIGLLGAVFTIQLQAEMAGRHSTGEYVEMLRSPSFMWWIVFAFVTYVVSQCCTAGMAATALRTGTTALSDALRSLREDGFNVLGVSVLQLLILLVLIVPALFTLGLGLLVLSAFLLYAIPAAVAGKRSAFGALGESFQIARRHFWKTLLIVVVLGVLLTVPAWIAGLFGRFAGPVVSAIVYSAATAYGLLVATSEYVTVRPVLREESPAATT
jgi:hypothetical protein